MKDSWTRATDAFAVALALIFALYLRFLFRGYVTGDFTEYTSVWYEAVQSQGFAAVGTAVANYTPPYLYLLYVTSILFPDLAPVIATKLPSTIGDLLCAWLVLRIVRLRYPSGKASWTAFFAALLAPTAVTNSAIWGQADSIYTSMLLASVFGLLSGRYVLTMLAFGLALSLKFQAMFLALALAALVVRRKIPLRTVLIVPVAYALVMVPAWLAGRPAIELATVYLKQAGTYPFLTANAPSLYAMLPVTTGTPFVIAGLLLTTVIGCRFLWEVYRSPKPVSTEVVLHLCMLSLILTPFFLPKMHDRFFYPADVLSIAYAFWFPRFYFVPIFVGFSSFFAYQIYLFGHSLVPLPLLSLILLVALVSVLRATREALI